MTDMEAIWKKNLEDLHNGVFGSNPNSPQTIFKYWKAQAEAQYPSAEENAKYWENLAKVDEQICLARKSRKKESDNDYTT